MVCFRDAEELRGEFVDETAGFVFELVAVLEETLLEVVEDLWVVGVVEDLWLVEVVETMVLVLELEAKAVEETFVDFEDEDEEMTGPSLPPETPVVGETLSGAIIAAFMYESKASRPLWFFYQLESTIGIYPAAGEPTNLSRQTFRIDSVHLESSKTRWRFWYSPSRQTSLLQVPHLPRPQSLSRRRF